MATGDFRYDPSMFIDTPLKNKEVDICYIDNTYFNPLFANIPTRNEALNKIISIIEEKRQKDTLFKLHLKILGKENLLVDLAEYFNLPIVVSQERYVRYTNVLGLNSNYFTTKFNANSLIFVSDSDKEEIDQENLDFVQMKNLIHIKPSGLILTNKNPNPSLTYFQVPYSDHSSYTEIKDFVKKLKPKRLNSIVRRFLPNCVDTTDLSELNVYLSQKPLPNCIEKYKLLLQSTTSARRSSRLNSHSLSTGKQVKTKLTNRNSTPINNRFITIRNKKTRKTKKQIEYETPEKNETPTSSDSSPQKVITNIPENNSINQVNVSSGKTNAQNLKLVKSNLETITEVTFETSKLDEDEYIDLSQRQEEENEVQVEADKQPRISKWRRLSNQVEILINSPKESDKSSDEIEDNNKILPQNKPIVRLEKLSNKDLAKHLRKTNTKKLDPVSPIEIEENETENEMVNLNTSKESIIIDHTIKDHIDITTQQVDQFQLPEFPNDLNNNNNNISININTSNHDQSIRKKESIYQKIACEFFAKIEKKSIDTSTKNETEKFLDFMGERLNAFDDILHFKKNTADLIETDILDIFEF